VLPFMGMAAPLLGRAERSSPPHFARFFGDGAIL
jgi:hypothetical protein